MMTPRDKSGFTLVELLTVIAIIAVLSLTALPSVSSILTSNGLTQAVNGISLTFEQARAYAMAHNTYVYVGLEETDETQSPAVKPQTTGIGRLYVGVVATKDGTPGYDRYNPLAGWNQDSASNLVAIQKLRYFDNVHLADALPATGNMVRPAANYQINANADPSLTSFTFPIAAAAPQCDFKLVIQFDPQGAATILTDSTGVALLPWMEIGLQPAHGKTVSTGANVAAVQIEGTTGAVHIYRP